MLIYKTGDLFTTHCTTLVNPVNCVGVMGAGLAAEFKRRWLAMFEAYAQACKDQHVCPGRLFIYKHGSPWVLCFPTKIQWQDPSKLEWIELGLKNFAALYTLLEITSIAFPALGCGLGGLAWQDVKPLMDKYLDLPIHIEVYGPDQSSIVLA
jgi:O-acetyl-ADP-ribose deacetylase (regulator of RNase III)